MEAKPLIKLTLFALLTGGSLFAASPEKPMVAAGLPLAGSTEGTYLFIQSEEVGPPAVYQVFRKSGDENSTDTFQMVGQMRPQTDPRTINALLLRGEALLNDDLSALESTLDSFLQAMVDDPSVAEITMPEKLATLVEVAMTDLEIRDNLRMLAKRFKGVGMAMGTAFAEEVVGEYTYELRQADFADQDPSASRLVVARLTVNTTIQAPLLKAPTSLVAIPMTDSRGHAVVRLRWASPDSLRARGPVHYGYQVYRDGIPVNDQPVLPQEELSDAEAVVTDINTAIEARFNIPSGWQTTVTASSLQADAAYAFPATEVARESDRVTRIANQETLEDLQGVFHFIDDGGLARGDGSGLVPGNTHIYTVAALDVLGRAGNASSPITVTVAGLNPPDVPTRVSTSNAYSYDSASQTTTQQLKVRWPVSRDENGNIRTDVSYLVYRWNSATEYVRYRDYPWGHGTTELDPTYAGRGLPPIGLVAAPSDLTSPVDGFMEWTDPTVDINYASLQLHYTVRAVVDSGNGFPVMSGHSAPTMGVLRDREGPGSATILGARLPCPLISVTCADDTNANFGTELGPNNKAFVDVSAVLTNSTQRNLFKAAEFSYKLGTTSPLIPIGSAEFDSGGKVSVRLSLETSQAPAMLIHCRVQLSNGFWSDETVCVLNPPKGSSRAQKRLNVQFDGYTYLGYGDCGSIYFPYEVGGAEIDPILGVTPAAETFAYSFYRRVDNGRLELIKNVEVEEELSTASALQLIDSAPPNFFKRLCYYYQGRDQHGNPGPLQRLECLSFGGPQAAMPQAQITRIYRTEGSTESNPGLTLEFFCPPEGIESFLIEVRNPTADVPLTLTAYDMQDRALNGTVEEKTYPEGHRYAAYSSVATSLLNEEAGVFSIDFGGIETDVDYVFRVIARGPYRADENAPARQRGISAAEGKPSAEETGNWRALAPREVSEVPMVRWPARGSAMPIDLATTPSLSASGPIALEFVDVVIPTADSWTVGWKGVGLEIANFYVNDEAGFGVAASYPNIDGSPQNTWPEIAAYLNIDQPENWDNKLYEVTIPGPLPGSSPVTRDLLPCVLYRMMVDENGDPVSGDLVQCSPLIANDYSLAIMISPTGLPSGFYMRDPFLIFGNAIPENTGVRVPLFIKDNQPVIEGERYRYYLALTDERGEIAAILNVGDITIPAP